MPLCMLMATMVVTSNFQTSHIVNTVQGVACIHIPTAMSFFGLCTPTEVAFDGYMAAHKSMGEILETTSLFPVAKYLDDVGIAVADLGTLVSPSIKLNEALTSKCR